MQVTVVRTRGPLADQDHDWANTVVLMPLDTLEQGAEVTCFAWTGEAQALARPREADEGGEVLRLVGGVWGDGAAPALFAVTADWSVGDSALAAAFEESRLALFHVRRRHLGGFVCDLLFKRPAPEPAGSSGYVVLGLYTDEETLRLARSHPAIQDFIWAHPASEFGATDVTGMQFFRVLGARAAG